MKKTVKEAEKDTENKFKCLICDFENLGYWFESEILAQMHLISFSTEVDLNVDPDSGVALSFSLSILFKLYPPRLYHPDISRF